MPDQKDYSKFDRRVNAAQVMKKAGYGKANIIILKDANKIWRDAAGLKGV